MTAEKTNSKIITSVNHNRANRLLKQSESLSITNNLLKTHERSLVQVAIGFGFASHCLKNWRETPS